MIHPHTCNFRGWTDRPGGSSSSRRIGASGLTLRWVAAALLFGLAATPGYPATLAVQHYLRGSYGLQQGYLSWAPAVEGDVLTDANSYYYDQSIGAGTRGAAASYSLRAAFGELGVDLSLYAHCFADGCGTEATDTPLPNFAYFNDSITLVNAPLEGYLQIDYLLEGVWNAYAGAGGSWTDQYMTLTANLYGQYVALANHGALADVWGHPDATGSFLASGTALLPYYGWMGNPLPLAVDLSAGIRCEASAVGGACGSEMHFLNTARIGGITILDPDRNPVAGAFVTAQSGHDYSAPVVAAVPEPAWLAASGILLVGLGRRCRRRD